MSVESWKEEFMPTPARMCDTDLDAVKHARRKWQGLREESLKRHQLEKVDDMLIYRHGGPTIESGQVSDLCKVNYPSIEINASTCGLCRIHLRMGTGCDECPLKIMLNDPCYEHDDSPYRVWLDTGDPEPMIEALRLLGNKLQFEEEAREKP